LVLRRRIQISFCLCDFVIIVGLKRGHLRPLVTVY